MINNEFYNHLEEGWYTELNHPVALLRAENRVRIPWIRQEIEKQFSSKISLLDIGCGAGLLTNALSLEGHSVSGIDISESSLKIAQKFDVTKKVDYKIANAYALPFASQQFDVVCAMDVLEHVEEPARLIQEAARVLKPGGLFFFHTFNRNWLSFLVIIKGVEWFVKNTPKNMHVYPLFIKPQELKAICQNNSLHIKTLIGLRPKFSSLSFWKLLFTRKISADFQFCFSQNLSTGYCGIAHLGDC